MDRTPNFRIRYRFYTPSESGRSVPPKQGYRCDWSYQSETIDLDGLSMIWPRFLNECGKELEQGAEVQMEGEADMYIVMEEMIQQHVPKLSVGVRGYLMEGGWRVAEATVIEVLSLSEPET